MAAGSGRNWFDCFSGARTARAPRRSMVRNVRGEIGAEDKNSVARIEKRLAKKLLENLRSRPGDDVVRFGRYLEFLADKTRRRRAKTGNSERRAVVRLVPFNGGDAGRLGRSRAVERAVANLELNDILALSLELFSESKNGKGGFYGKRLSKSAQRGGHGVVSLVRSEVGRWDPTQYASANSQTQRRRVTWSARLADSIRAEMEGACGRVFDATASAQTA